jgi:hypothetical protein
MFVALTTSITIKVEKMTFHVAIRCHSNRGPGRRFRLPKNSLFVNTTSLYRGLVSQNTYASKYKSIPR